MATTLANLETYTRALLREATAGGFTQAQVNVWLNEAQRIFVFKTNCLKGVGSIATVAQVRDYALPTDVIDFNSIDGVYYDQDVKLQRLSQVEFYNYAGNAPYQSGQPEFYMLENGRLNIYPVPGSSDDAATTTLGAAISDTTGTTVTVAANTVFPFTSGRFIVDTEVIEFRGTSSTTSLINCRRGVEGTTAATHSNGATITERDLRLIYIRAPLTMTSTVDSEIPDPYAHALTHYAAAMGFQRRGDMKAAQMYLQQWEREVAEANSYLNDIGKHKDRYPQILPIEAVARTGYGRV